MNTTSIRRCFVTLTFALGLFLVGGLTDPSWVRAQVAEPYAEPTPSQRYVPPATEQPAYPQQGAGQQVYPQQHPYQQQPAPQPQGVHVPIFFAAAAGAWVPWTGTFADNHKGGGAIDLMVGFSLEPFIRKRVDLFIDVMGSQHKLQERAWLDADHTTTTVLAGCVGARIFLLQPLNIGAPYLLVAGGLVYENAETTSTHAPPQPSWMTMAGVGWEAPLGSVLRLGARVVATYLDEDGSRLGWIAPSITLGFEI